ncbi:MAG: uroporphyrinogen-III synthase [Rhodoferax sp.]|nr:uroporphyrinogen-III synthase [Rhodoferax sp.]
MRVVVTRPQPEADQWVRALRASGYDAQALPLIVVEPPPDPLAVRAAWDRLSDYDALMFVSGNAVQHFFALQPAPEPVFAPHSRFRARAFVTGPGSTAALLRCGAQPDYIDVPDNTAGQFDSEALWAVVQHWVSPGYRVLIVRGTTRVGPAAVSEGVGRDWFARQVATAGGQVDFVVAYQRGGPLLGAEQLSLIGTSATDDSVWLFSSSEAVGNLSALLPQQDWSQARAVASHARIAQAAKDAGFAVVCESRPTLAAMVASIESLQ